jgi:hypothetical protein
MAPDPRREDLDDLSGSDDLPEPAPDDPASALGRARRLQRCPGAASLELLDFERVLEIDLLQNATGFLDRHFDPSDAFKRHNPSQRVSVCFSAASLSKLLAECTL